MEKEKDAEMWLANIGDRCNSVAWPAELKQRLDPSSDPCSIETLILLLTDAHGMWAGKSFKDAPNPDSSSWTASPSPGSRSRTASPSPAHEGGLLQLTHAIVADVSSKMSDGELVVLEPTSKVKGLQRSMYKCKVRRRPVHEWQGPARL